MSFIYPAPSTTSSTFNSSFFSSSISLKTVLNVDTNRNISDVSNLTASGTISAASVSATNLTGTLQTAAQPNITSVGNLSALSVGGTNIITAIAPISGITLGTAAANKVLSTDSSNYVSGLTRLSIGTVAGVMHMNVLTGGDATLRLGHSETTNKCWSMTYLTATNLLRFDAFSSNSQMTLSTAGDLTAKASFDTLAYKLNGAAVSMDSITGITLGTPAASKALTLNASSQLAGGLAITGTLSTAAINASTVITSTLPADGVSFRSINGTSTCSLFHFASGSAYFGTSSVHDLIFQTSGTQRFTITATGAVSCAGAFSASTLTGTIQTGAQANIASLGTLAANLTIGSTFKLVMGGQASPVASIDMGQPPSTNRAIALFNDNTSYYGHGVSSSLLKAFSFGGHQWFTATTSASLGTSIMTLSSAGALSVDQIVATTSLTVAGLDVGAALSASGTATASKALVLDSSGSITFGAGSSSNSYIRFGGTSSAASKLFYDSTNAYMTLDSGSNPLGGLRLTNNYFNFSGTMLSLKANSTQISFDISSLTSSAFMGTYGGSLNITTNTSASNSSTNCLYFGGNSGSIGINTQSPDAAFSLDLNGYARVRNTLCLGTSTDTSAGRMLSILDSSMTNSTIRYITLGRSAATDGQAEISYTYSTTAGSSLLGFGFYGASGGITMDSNLNIGIGITATGTARLYINGTGSGNFNIDAAGTGVWVQSKTSGSSTIGPISSVALSLRTSSNVLIGGMLYITSDRRLKTDIVDVGLADSLKFVNDVSPSYFRMSNNHDRQIGYVAQDIVLAGFGELISAIEHEDMAATEDGDVEGYQLSVSYDRVCAHLHNVVREQQKVIEDLLKRLEVINDSLEKIESYNPLAKHLAKLEG